MYEAQAFSKALGKWMTLRLCRTVEEADFFVQTRVCKSWDARVVKVATMGLVAR